MLISFGFCFLWSSFYVVNKQNFQYYLPELNEVADEVRSNVSKQSCPTQKMKNYIIVPYCACFSTKRLKRCKRVFSQLWKTL